MSPPRRRGKQGPCGHCGIESEFCLSLCLCFCLSVDCGHKGYCHKHSLMYTVSIDSMSHKLDVNQFSGQESPSHYASHVYVQPSSCVPCRVPVRSVCVCAFLFLQQLPCGEMDLQRNQSSVMHVDPDGAPRVHF
jgi:hypothetical protein